MEVIELSDMPQDLKELSKRVQFRGQQQQQQQQQPVQKAGDALHKEQATQRRHLLADQSDPV